MKKACQYCGHIHNKNDICPKKPKKKQSGKDNKSEAVKFRSSLKWTRKARRIKERDGWCCRMCLKEGIINYRDLEVHHIIKLKDDITKGLEEDNLITLCHSCHRMADDGRISEEELRELVRERNGDNSDGYNYIY